MVHTPYPLIVHHSSAIQVPVVMCRVFHRHVCGLISPPFRDPSSPKTLDGAHGGGGDELRRAGVLARRAAWQILLSV